MDLQSIDTSLSVLNPELKNLAQTRIDFFLENAEKHQVELDLNSRLSAQMASVLLYSEYIATSLVKDPQTLKDLVESEDLVRTYSENEYEKKFAAVIEPDMEVSQVKEVLMESRQYEMIRIAWRDLAGEAELDETLQDLSCLADAVLKTAVNALYDHAVKDYGIPVDSKGNAQGLIVLGMGKLGAKELNFSSDIDLIFVFPENGYTQSDDVVSCGEFFTKVCRKLVQFFSSETYDYNFYRVDTRLRPYGDGGPLVMSASAFEEYYQAQGREWERYAMIKARPVAGDIAAGETLLKTLNSFVYRRYFDYGSFDAFRDMKHRISLQVKSKRLKNNIKLGAGGIREIEFFGQLFQLIRGGVEPELQERKIMKVLDLLVSHNCIQPKVSLDLKAAYIFLRLVENRLQEYADQQTHDIPDNTDRRLILALSMGYDSWDEFNKELEHQLTTVHHHFQQLLAGDETTEEDKEILALKEMWLNVNDPQFRADAKHIKGFESADRILDMMRNLEAHPNTKRLTFNGRKKLVNLVPLLIKAISRQEDPEAILVQLIDLIITIERRTCYLSLLIENKNALENLVTLATQSPWIIGFISRHPVLLDELIQPKSLYAPPGKKALARQMEIRMASARNADFEQLLEELCIFRQLNMLRVAAADVSGNYPLMKVSDHLTYIAETVVSQVLKIAWRIVAQKYGVPENVPEDDIDRCGFAVIAYGKVGGLEMGYKSDIDLVFLHSAEEGMTNGPERSIENVRFYTNLGQRIINALTVHTPAGTLYGADMRLRPGGNSGTVVSHVNAYEEYLNETAWTWEHQALIRARWVAGDKSLCERFERIRTSVLTKPRDENVIKQEVAQMRERMRQERLKGKDVSKGFELKQSEGGIVDIEFLVQYLVLNNAGRYPDIVFWTDNMRLLESLDAEGVITGCESEQLQDAYIAMRKLIHRRNLQDKDMICEETFFEQKRKNVRSIYEKYLMK